jgi:hypothetical protein
MGKDESVILLKSILEKKNLSFHHTYFAKMLKQHCSERYGLDFNRMSDDTYKSKKIEHLENITVRDILIKEGCFARSLWGDVWAFPAYKEILLSQKSIGIISDFRFPNEYSCFDKCFNICQPNTLIKPRVIKVLVQRPDIKFENDGADDQLPDIDPYWDYTILNNDKTEKWKKNLEKQLEYMVESIIGDNNVL